MAAFRFRAIASRSSHVLSVVCVMLVCRAAEVRADVVHTKDGSRIVGTVKTWAADKLVIETTIAGTLEILRDQIVAVESDEPLNVQFTSGDRLVGGVDVSDDLQTATVHTEIGEFKVPTGRIASVWPVGQESPEVVTLRAEVEAAELAARPDWTLTLDLGAQQKEGNTETIDAHGRLDVVRKTDEDLLRFYLAAEYSETDDTRTKNEYRGGIRYRNNVGDTWYWYTRLELEFDEFEDLDLRSTTSLGGGYFWIKRPEQELTTSLGLGYRHESFMTGRIENQAIFDLGLDYRVDIADTARFTHSLIYSPDIEEFNQYRLEADTALVFPFKDPAWKWKIGIRNEYNSDPEPGLEALDSTYYTSLVFELKDKK